MYFFQFSSGSIYCLNPTSALVNYEMEKQIKALRIMLYTIRPKNSERAAPTTNNTQSPLTKSKSERYISRALKY